MPRRDVPADLAACEAADRRGRLSWLMHDETRVRVRNPLKTGGTWEGVIIGLADHPTMLLRYDDGRVWPLPQAYAVEVVAEADAVGSDGDAFDGTEERSS